MIIVFTSLPRYLDLISIFLKKMGHTVFYLNLSGTKNTAKERERVETLKIHGVLPLPFEDLPHFKDYAQTDGDPDMIAYKRTLEIASVEYLDNFKGLFPNIANISKKLQVVIHLHVATQQMYVTGKINIWANTRPKDRFLLIDVSPESLISPQFAPNVRRLILPLDPIFQILFLIVQMLQGVIERICKFFMKRDRLKSEIKKDRPLLKKGSSRVAIVTHHGLQYSRLFPKDLFYSPDVESELHRENVIHIDYAGYTSPSDEIRWVCMGNHKESLTMNIRSALIAFFKGCRYIRNIQDILTLFMVTRAYILHKSYTRQLEAFPELKLALIDYEVLCPRELILACESRGITTLAVQERFIHTFFYSFTPPILNYYLCDSPFVAERMMQFPLNIVDHYIPVGQYRSDILIAKQKADIPYDLKIPRSEGRKIITALGFFTLMEWQDSQLNLLLNWKSHQHFLDDMIKLAKDNPEIFIILRYKYIEWMALPVFQETVKMIQSSNNMRISTDYQIPYVSYDLCAHSDLVIAKNTSLADECLSAGIPTIFHEYTHNTKRLVADSFDYSPADIMCYSYDELKQKTEDILDDSRNCSMIRDFEYLRKNIYGGLGDGKVKERIHSEIKAILAKL